MRKIERALPEARFVHVIRDGRDVALSIRDRAVKEHPIDRIAERWVRRITRAREQAKRLAHYEEIRYENLILDTAADARARSASSSSCPGTTRSSSTTSARPSGSRR